MGIYIIKSRDASGSPEDIRIVFEGQRFLQDLDNYALAAAMLFGLMYTLNLTYLLEVRYTLRYNRNWLWSSKKAQFLRNRLYE